jgi:cell division protein FtsL
MGKLNFVLVAALIVSALVLVRTSYESRRVFTAIERAKADARQLDTEFKRLDAERQAQATSMRVERVARERLRMHSAAPGEMFYALSGAASGGQK